MTSFDRLAEPLVGIDWRWALMALVFQMGNITCRAFAWRNVMAAAFPDERLPVRQVGLAYTIGMALNGYLPARGGEAAKVAMIRAQRPGANVVTVASSSTVVLVFDSIMGVSLIFMAWMLGALPAAPVPPGALMTLADRPVIAFTGVVLALGSIAWLARRVAPRVRGTWTSIRQGLAVLRTPGRYLRTVALVQSGAWTCRMSVVFCLLGAFHIAPSPQLAALVVVFGGMSTLVPVPGGAGSQQVLVVYALTAATTTAHALSFSIGMQVGVTAVNTTLGILAAMVVFRSFHPLTALRAVRVVVAGPRPATEPGPA